MRVLFCSTFILVLGVAPTRLNAQSKTSNCLELLKENAELIKSKNYSAKDENRLFSDFNSCDINLIRKSDIYELLGEPNEIKNFYSGIDKVNYKSFIYYLKPTYESKYFIGQTLQFQFKESEETCSKIEKVRYCE